MTATTTVMTTTAALKWMKTAAIKVKLMGKIHCHDRDVKSTLHITVMMKVKVDEDHQVVTPKVDEDGNQDNKVKLDQVGDEMDLNHHQSRKKVCIICMQKANREFAT